MRLLGQEEIIWSHAVIQLKHIHYFLLLLSAIFVTAALYFATLDILLPYENYFHDKQFNNTRRRYITHDATLSEAVAAMDEKHPLHGIYNLEQIRYNYGSHWHNYCKMIPAPEGRFVPSLLRLMQLRIDTQATLRSIVLLIFMTQACLTCVRSKLIFLRSKSNSFLIRKLAEISPLLDLVQSTFAVLILCFSWNVDASLQWLMRDCIIYFGCTFMAHALLYTLFEMIDKEMNTSKMKFRIVCMMVFFVCIGDTNALIQKWYDTKPCHTYVTASEGVMEYLCIASIVFFHLSKIGDYNNMTMVLSCVEDETKICSNFTDFKPAFAHSKEFDNSLFADYRPLVKRSIDAKF